MALSFTGGQPFGYTQGMACLHRARLWPIGFALSLAALLLVTHGALGQPRHDGDYQGVTPGRGHAPPRAPAGEGRPVATWPGFQIRPDGSSRFFVQVTTPVETRLSADGEEVSVTLQNATVHLWNNHRPLVTRFFNTPVNVARLVRRGRHAVLRLNLRSSVTPTVTTEQADNGYYYVYVDFPAGQYENLL